MNLGIVILNYNGWSDTVECLDSLSKTTYENKCILVIDNFSKNDSFVKLIEYARDEWKYDFQILNSENDLVNINNNKLLIYQSDCNTGFAGGNNLGIRILKRNQINNIMLLNNDTVVDENFIIPLLRELDKYKSNIMLTSRIVNYNNHNEYIVGGKLNYYKGSGYHIKRDMNHICDFISGCIWLFNANLVDYVGYLNEKYFLYVEDVEYCFRLKKYNIPVKCVNDSIVYHKESRSTPIKDLNYYYNTRNRLYLINEYFNAYHKLIFYVFFVFSRILIIIKKPSSYKYIIRGISDYKKNIGGSYK